MTGMAFVCTVMLLGIGGAVLIALLSGEDSGRHYDPGAFALLPVTEDSPSAKALLEHYASQIEWMDAQVLHCVILVSIPDTQSLCEELARDHDCYRTMTLPEVQALLTQLCSKMPDSGKS